MYSRYIFFEILLTRTRRSVAKGKITCDNLVAVIFLFYYSFWELLNAEHSHIAQVTVPLLLHCVTLPCGTDTFWRLVQEEFHNSDWRVRFVAGIYVACNKFFKFTF